MAAAGKPLATNWQAAVRGRAGPHPAAGPTSPQPAASSQQQPAAAAAITLTERASSNGTWDCTRLAFTSPPDDELGWCLVPWTASLVSLTNVSCRQRPFSSFFFYYLFSRRRRLPGSSSPPPVLPVPSALDSAAFVRLSPPDVHSLVRPGSVCPAVVHRPSSFVLRRGLLGGHVGRCLCYLFLPGSSPRFSLLALLALSLLFAGLCRRAVAL